MSLLTNTRNKTKAGRILSQDMAVEYALAGVGAIVYTVLPTAVNWTGPKAMALALVPCIGLGVWMESPTLLAGTLFVALVHLIYKYGSTLTLKWWGRTVWSLDTATPLPSTTPATDLGDYVAFNRNAYGAGMNDAVQLPNGYSALALPPADVPAPSQSIDNPGMPSHGMNDYVMPHGQLMDGEDGFLGTSRQDQNGSFDGTSMFE